MDRVQRGLRRRPPQSRIAGFATVALAVVSGLADATKIAAQTQAKLAFDVISVKPNRSGGSAGNIHNLPDGLQMDNFPLDTLIQFAYELNFDGQMIGVPSWATTERYDIDARVTADDVERFKKLTPEQRDAMMQSILIERFKLSAHHQTEQLPVYDLVTTKSSPGPALVKPGDASQRAPYLNTSDDRISMHDEPIGSLASALMRKTHRTVVDKTRLTGHYDLELRFAPNSGTTPTADAGQNPEPAADSAGPSLFTALQEQLGLKLKADKGPVDCLVVDHIERPSAN
jgi:uncharacterized protein (TIGR03435 family)